MVLFTLIGLYLLSGADAFAPHLKHTKRQVQRERLFTEVRIRNYITTLSRGIQKVRVLTLILRILDCPECGSCLAPLQ